MIRPRPLQPGDVVGVVAPSSAVTGLRDQIEAGIAALRALGFRTRAGRHLYDDWLGLAGTHADRADDINGMFADPAVRMVIAAQGGWGCLALTDRLDFAALRADPKWVCGVSDVSILLNACTARSGVQTLHGPDVAWGLAVPDYRPLESPWFLRAVTEQQPLGLLPTWSGGVRVLRPGRATGRLWGGNLHCLGHLFATPWSPSLEGAVLFLEDVGQAKPQVHRWLQTLRLQGYLAQLHGLVLGTWNECFAGEDDPQAALEALVEDACAGTSFPIIEVDNIGHNVANVPLPVGGEAEVSEEGIRILS